MHIKNQTIKDRRIYVRVMFRLKEMLRDICDYYKTLRDRFRQLVNCDNNISRCARKHCLENTLSRFEMHITDCETFA